MTRNRAWCVAAVLLTVLAVGMISGCGDTNKVTNPSPRAPDMSGQADERLPLVNGQAPPYLEPPDSIKAKGERILRELAGRQAAPMQVIAGVPSWKILNQAYSWLGVPYRWGGNSRSGIDCSHLVYQVYRGAGITSYPFMTTSQMKSYPYFTRVAWNDEGGDIVLFQNLGHTGIYVGCGWFIDANSYYGKVMYDGIFSPYWQSMKPYAVRFTPPMCFP